MLTDLLKRNNFFSLSFCLVVQLLLWLPRLLFSDFFPAYQLPPAPQSPWLLLLPETPLLPWAAFLLTFAAAWAFLILNNRHMFHSTNEFLLPLLYILLSSAIPSTQWFSGVQVAVLFIFTGLNYLFLSSRRHTGLREIFTASFCFVLAALCFPPALLLLLLLPVGLIVLRPFAWHDWVVALFGMLTPLGYLLLGYWLTAHDIAPAGKDLMQLLPEIPDIATLSSNLPAAILLGCIVWLLIVSSIRTLSQQSGKKVRTMHIRSLFVWFILFIAGGLIVYPTCNYQMMPLLAMPLTIVLATYFAQPGGRKLKAFSWILLIAAVIYAQVADFL